MPALSAMVEDMIEIDTLRGETLNARRAPPGGDSPKRFRNGDAGQGREKGRDPFRSPAPFTSLVFQIRIHPASERHGRPSPIASAFRIRGAPSRDPNVVRVEHREGAGLRALLEHPDQEPVRRRTEP